MKLLRMVFFGAMTAVLLSLDAGICDEPLRIDWNRAWDLALENSEQLAAARDEIIKSEHKVGEAYSGALPTVEANGIFQHYFKVPQSVFILPPEMTDGDQELRLKIKRSSDNNALADISITQPLYVGGKVGIALELATLYYQISEYGFTAKKNELRHVLVQAFYGALLGGEYTRISREALAQVERHHDQAQNLFDQGMVSEYDLIRARVAVANVKPQVTEAEAIHDLALKNLKLLIGIDIDRELEVIGDLDLQVDDPIEYEVSIKGAFTARPELKQLEFQAMLYEGQHKIEKRSTLWPNVLVNSKYETMASANDLKFGKYEFLGGYSGSLILQVPVFDGFASYHRSEIARVNKRAAERQKALLERGIRLQVYKAISDFNTAVEKLRAANESLSAAEKGAEIAEVRYQQGMSTQLEWLDAQLQNNNSRVRVLQAKYDLLVARAAYDLAVGSKSDS